MTERDFDNRVDAILEELKTSAHFEDLEEAVTFRKGVMRPSEAPTRYTLMVTRDAIASFDMVGLGGGLVDVTMIVAVQLLTKNVGGYEALEMQANEFAARAYMALMDNVSRGNADGDGWDSLLLEGSATAEREPDKQEQVQEEIECMVRWTMPTATS